jgi:hypothetical protein
LPSGSHVFKLLAPLLHCPHVCVVSLCGPLLSRPPGCLPASSHGRHGLASGSSPGLRPCIWVCVCGASGYRIGRSTEKGAAGAAQPMDARAAFSFGATWWRQHCWQLRPRTSLPCVAVPPIGAPRRQHPLWRPTRGSGVAVQGVVRCQVREVGKGAVGD